jgi:hypothetical protein
MTERKYIPIDDTPSLSNIIVVALLIFFIFLCGYLYALTRSLFFALIAAGIAFMVIQRLKTYRVYTQ